MIFDDIKFIDAPESMRADTLFLPNFTFIFGSCDFDSALSNFKLVTKIWESVSSRGNVRGAP